MYILVEFLFVRFALSYYCVVPLRLPPRPHAPLLRAPRLNPPSPRPVDKGGWPSHHLFGRRPAPSGDRVGAAAGGGGAYPGCVVNLRQKQAGAFVFGFTREYIIHIRLDACVMMSFASTWGPTTPRRAAAATKYRRGG